MSFKEKIFEKEGRAFPGATYSEIVLAPAYEQAKRFLLDPMIAIHKAHLIMLAEQGILPESEAAQIAEGIQGLDKVTLMQSTYDGKYEDLFFLVESKIMDAAGEIGGSLHIARSRNDMGVAMYRMVLRDQLQSAMKELLAFQETLLEVIDTYKETIVLGHTHTQQAQPMTFSHYLLGMYDVVERDFKRLKAAYDTCNLSPLGAAAFTTTGFPIDRIRVAELLGFQGIVQNAYDSISGADYLGEAAAAVQLAFINLGRFSQDLLLWSSQEFSAIRVADPYVQTSSIMPQKRNPVSLEHIRALSSSGIGNAQTVLQMLHNTPYGDINDTEDDLQPYLWKSLALISQVFRLTKVVVGTIEVNEALLKKRAKESFAAITELADTIFRETKIPFRTAHSIASKVVGISFERELNATHVTSRLVDEAAAGVVGYPLNLPEEVVRTAMDPGHFVQIRSHPGGPAPKEMKRGIAVRKERLRENIKALKAEADSIDECTQRLDQLIQGFGHSNKEDDDTKSV
ncbi:argininosuccinate lyase [Heyndrickxia acidicola]|uniref:Argininosuccinate lyase n=1 Tax=Heyndrickxia acidicola TaxID=209389 RepID=A0ABU6MH45_9BACI|nr:argininosuccinate lyase [Heyndrickxia acidicola]MED1203722.1 argininosuccinate lyase [Heyndrickxia acidicola]